MNALVDFLNHGTLPFVGREADHRRLVEFWRGVFDARELRVMVMFGEAGVGKSRLREQVVRTIVESRGSVVHVKIYTGATTPLCALVAGALGHPDAGGRLLAAEPEASPGAVGMAMQRLARLRPTMLILEDLHLLGAEAVPEITQLLSMLADESIAVLVLARPVDLDTRAALEPYLIEECTLHGLSREDCAAVWEQVSGAILRTDVAEALHEATAGNPMALRSALRDAFGARDGIRTNAANVLPAAASAEALVRTLKRSVTLLADVMTAHLSTGELRAAKRLATLGEIFSREAAAVVLDDAEAYIESLQFKGIIGTAVAPPEPLPGPVTAAAPLGFSHTLLHRQLIEAADVEAEQLVRVIDGSPLYSILPFQLLDARRWSAPTIGADEIERAFDRTIRVQVVLNRSPQWARARHTWGTAVRLLAARLGTWERAAWERMLVRLVNHRLNMVRREPLDVRLRWLEYLESITAEISSDELAVGRLHALYNRELMFSQPDPDITGRLWAEAEKLTEERPHLRCTIAYVDYVIAASISAHGNQNRKMLREIEGRTNTILALPELPDRVRTIFERQVRPPMLMLYDSYEEQRERLDTIALFERTVGIGELNVWTFCVDVLAEAGSVETLCRICDGIMPVIRKQGMTSLLVDTVARQQSLLAGIADSFASVLDVFDGALAELPAWRRAQVEGAVAVPLVEAALLRGDGEAAHALVRRYGVNAALLAPVDRVALALHSEHPWNILNAWRAEGLDEGELTAAVEQAMQGGLIDHAHVQALLAAPPLRLTDILRTSTILRLLNHARRGSKIAADPRKAVQEALARALEWLGASERGLHAYMTPMLELGRDYCSARDLTAWGKRVSALAGERHAQETAAAGGRALRLSMLGTIAATASDGSRQRFQGARARMLLATMVINRMLHEPLSPAEFCRMAAGEEVIEIENARDVVKTTVHRVRELIGHDAILTDGQSPRLNPDLVTVDLIEAHDLLKRAAEMLRTASPMQASAALAAAFDIANGDVPFPSLYDDFVEAAREDFETLLRTTAVDVARALEREGGIDDAAAVLRRAADAIPGDEDLTDQLHEALRRAGKSTDAVRARRRGESN